jgi:signal transduction histidine kinase
LFDSQGEQVLAMVEIYKEPQDLVRRIQRGYVLIWGSTLAGGALIYFGLFWIVRRAAGMLHQQQDRLVASETYAALGEMSSALAHSLRNPLANIRSSAELAQEIANPAAQKNIGDIVTQVDRMSRWVRDLLVSLRPVSDEPEAVDLVAAIEDARQTFTHRSSVTRCASASRARRAVGGQPAVAADADPQQPVRQRAGSDAAGRRVACRGADAGWAAGPVLLSDTGKGMTEQQKRMVFKPFFTTKQGGLVSACVGQTHHGALWRFGRTEQPRRGRNPRQPYFQSCSGRGPWITASWW